MTGPEATTAELEARLAAQRRVLEWLLEKLVTDRDTLADLTDAVGADRPPQDGQEDPGAVLTSAFGDAMAANAELRLLLAPLKARLGAPDKI